MEAPSKLIRMTQAEVDEICRRHQMLYERRVGGARAGFSFSDLSRLKLRGRRLNDADFSGARMWAIDLAAANLDNANLFGTDLRRARLDGARMFRADLRGACFEDARMRAAILESADLREGRIATSDPSGHLDYRDDDGRGPWSGVTSFARADMERCKLAGVLAYGVDFRDAHLRSTDFTRARLRDACLNGANLENADLTSADLSGADLSGAVLVGANLNMTNLRDANLDGALTDRVSGVGITEFGRSIDAMMHEHARFIETQGKGGQPMSFELTDFRPAGSLASQNLPALRAIECVFYGLDLNGILMQGATLEGSDLRLVKLEEADLRGRKPLGCQPSEGKSAALQSWCAAANERPAAGHADEQGLAA